MLSVELGKEAGGWWYPLWRRRECGQNARRTAGMQALIEHRVNELNKVCKIRGLRDECKMQWQ